MDYEITDEDVELVLEAVGVDVEEMNAVADESSRSESDGKYRSCGCGGSKGKQRNLNALSVVLSGLSTRLLVMLMGFEVR